MKALVRYLPLLILALAWELAARLHLVSSTALPPLSDVIAAWIDMIKDGDLLTNGASSLYRAGAGLALSIAVGSVLGIAMAWWKPANVLLSPLVESPPQKRACSTLMQRSTTTSSPLRSASSIASSLTMPY